MSRLRAVVGDALIETRPAGMVLRIEPNNVDALRFIRLAHTHRSRNDLDSARRHWQEALDLLVVLDVDQTEDAAASTADIQAYIADLDAR